MIKPIMERRSAQVGGRGSRDRILLDIARGSIDSLRDRSDLRQHKSDEEDFFEVSIWELEDALRMAYEEGRKSVREGF